MGFDPKLVGLSYSLEEKVTAIEADVARLLAENAGAETPDQLRGIIEIAQRDVAMLQAEVQDFDLAPADSRFTQTLVHEVDQMIARLNEERYEVLSEQTRIQHSLATRLSVDLDMLQGVFEQSKIYFGDQVRKDYGALARFNEELVAERDSYLREELLRVEAGLEAIDKKLNELNAQRARDLVSLRDTEALSKYKRLSRQAAEREMQLQAALRRFSAVEALQARRRELRASQLELAQNRERLEEAINAGSARCSDIRKHLDAVVFRVTGHHANLFIRLNGEGHVEFEVQLVDAKGTPTSAGDGFSYGRLTCLAFDIAVVHSYSRDRYPHFVYHDGALETLDDRKKLNLIEVARDFGRGGAQYIWTAIESELPILADGTRFQFLETEVICRLSDDGDRGRLFKMPEW